MSLYLFSRRKLPLCKGVDLHASCGAWLHATAQRRNSGSENAKQLKKVQKSLKMPVAKWTRQRGTVICKIPALLLVSVPAFHFLIFVIVVVWFTVFLLLFVWVFYFSAFLLFFFGVAIRILVLCIFLYTTSSWIHFFTVL